MTKHEWHNDEVSRHSFVIRLRHSPSIIFPFGRIPLVNPHLAFLFPRRLLGVFGRILEDRLAGRFDSGDFADDRSLSERRPGVRGGDSAGAAGGRRVRRGLVSSSCQLAAIVAAFPVGSRGHGSRHFRARSISTATACGRGSAGSCWRCSASNFGGACGSGKFVGRKSASSKPRTPSEIERDLLELRAVWIIALRRLREASPMRIRRRVS